MQGNHQDKAEGGEAGPATALRDEAPFLGRIKSMLAEDQQCQGDEWKADASPQTAADPLDPVGLQQLHRQRCSHHGDRIDTQERQGDPEEHEGEIKRAEVGLHSGSGAGLSPG